MRQQATDRGPLLRAGILLGLGLGGFVDGILLHQVLQWHHLLTSAGYSSTSVLNLEINTFWDGLFHAFTWILTVVGLFLLWSALRRGGVPWSTRSFVATLLIGWGAFNLVERIVDHHLLGIHHVNERVPRDQWIWWDLGFLAVGLLLVAVGWSLVRSSKSDVLLPNAAGSAPAPVAEG